MFIIYFFNYHQSIVDCYGRKALESMVEYL